MQALLAASRAIDALNLRVGRSVMWLVLAACLAGTVNAILQKFFRVGLIALDEAQWYMFAALFLLAGGYTLLRDEHVRIDAISHRFGARTRAWIEVAGTLLFLMPLVLLMLRLSWAPLADAYLSGERSGNAGGLTRWPVLALVPAGFALLGLQGLSELIKRVAFLRGLGPDPRAQHHGRSAEEELAQEIAAQHAPIGDDTPQGTAGAAPR